MCLSLNISQALSICSESLHCVVCVCVCEFGVWVCLCLCLCLCTCVRERDLVIQYPVCGGNFILCKLSPVASQPLPPSRGPNLCAARETRMLPEAGLFPTACCAHVCVCHTGSHIPIIHIHCSLCSECGL